MSAVGAIAATAHTLPSDQIRQFTEAGDKGMSVPGGLVPEASRALRISVWRLRDPLWENSWGSQVSLARLQEQGFRGQTYLSPRRGQSPTSDLRLRSLLTTILESRQGPLKVGVPKFLDFSHLEASIE